MNTYQLVIHHTESGPLYELQASGQDGHWCVMHTTTSLDDMVTFENFYNITPGKTINCNNH